MDASQLKGLSLEQAECYGKPHIGAFYATASVRSNRLKQDAVCPICGNYANESHHIPPTGMGGGRKSFDLHGWSLRPSLIAVCGSGNTSGCHGKLHKHEVRITWEWYKPEYQEKWWSGELLDLYGMHSPDLFKFGRWVINENGKCHEYRGGSNE